MAKTAFPQFDIPSRKDNLAIFDGSYLTDTLYFLSQWQTKRVVLVVSKTLYNTTDHVQKLAKKLGDKLVGTKIGVAPHSPYDDVIAIAHLVQDKEADCLISIGSSSYNDASKIASKLANTLPPNFIAKDMEKLVNQEKGYGALNSAKVTLIQIPTSLSAAEWNGVGSCTNSTGKKQHFGLSNLQEGSPDLILCDPELASTAPASLWLSSGVRCVDHCIETICNAHCKPAAEEEALEGLGKLISGLIKYKENVKTDHEDMIRGISEAQKGSRQAIKALIVYRNTVGPSHAIGHQLGSVAGVTHGVTSCIMLAPVLRYTAARAKENSNFSRAPNGQANILKVFNDTLGWKEADAADALEKFVKQLGLPTRLSEVNVTDEKLLDKIAEATMTDVWGGAQKQITEKKEIRVIIDSAR